MKTKHKKAAPERGGKTKTMFAVVSASPESLSSPADEINRLHDELNELARTALQTAMHIGELLTEQKAKCGHGKWLKWLKENVRFSQPTAWNYMRLHAERAKLSTVDNLTAAYRLLAGESRYDDEDRDDEPEAEVEVVDDARKLPMPSEPLSLEFWAGLDKDTKKQALTVGKDWRSSFNPVEQKIEWARYTWNPVTGCLHNCNYCYARDIATRFTDTYPHGFAPAIIPERLAAPSMTTQSLKVSDTTKDPAVRMAYRNVFVCSMADLFGKWVPKEWIDAVIEQVKASPQWHFLFLTKFPIRMAEFQFPPNAWVGTSVDRQAAVERAETAFAKVKASVKWLSCEPMLERLTFTKLELFDWLVVGGASKSTQTSAFFPDREWVAHLENQARKVNVPVYEKENLLERITEYPIQ